MPPRSGIPAAARASDLGFDVLDDQVDPVPAARAARAPVEHRAGGRAPGTVAEQAQVAAGDVRERGALVGAQVEAEVPGVPSAASFRWLKNATAAATSSTR
jgi:hypothetical protein